MGTRAPCERVPKPPLPCRPQFVRLRSRARRCRGPAMRKHFAIAAIVAVLAGPGMRGAATAEPQAGEVLALFGQCFVETAGRRNALKPGDAVHVGDSLDVAAGAKLKLRMSEGSVIAVASDTRFAIADYRLGTGGGGGE